MKCHLRRAPGKKHSSSEVKEKLTNWDDVNKALMGIAFHGRMRETNGHRAKTSRFGGCRLILFDLQELAFLLTGL